MYARFVEYKRADVIRHGRFFFLYKGCWTATEAFLSKSTARKASFSLWEDQKIDDIELGLLHASIDDSGLPEESEYVYSDYIENLISVLVQRDENYFAATVWKISIDTLLKKH